MSIYQEIRLYNNANQREAFDNRAELYSIIKTIQELEKAFIKDALPADIYTRSCSKLLTQYKSALKVADVTDVNVFVKKYSLECPLAMERIREDRPTTQRDDKGNFNALIGDIVALFITIQDHLSMEQRAKDEIFPDMTELITNMDRMTTCPSTIKESVKMWEGTLKPMAASEELTGYYYNFQKKAYENEVFQDFFLEEQARQMAFDIESSYNAFNQFLKDGA